MQSGAVFLFSFYEKRDTEISQPRFEKENDDQKTHGTSILNTYLRKTLEGSFSIVSTTILAMQYSGFFEILQLFFIIFILVHRSEFKDSAEIRQILLHLF